MRRDDGARHKYFAAEGKGYDRNQVFAAKNIASGRNNCAYRFPYKFCFAKKQATPDLRGNNIITADYYNACTEIFAGTFPDCRS